MDCDRCSSSFSQRRNAVVGEVMNGLMNDWISWKLYFWEHLVS
jgi:hypothetical protein